MDLRVADRTLERLALVGNGRKGQQARMAERDNISRILCRSVLVLVLVLLFVAAAVVVVVVVVASIVCDTQFTASATATIRVNGSSGHGGGQHHGARLVVELLEQVEVRVVVQWRRVVLVLVNFNVERVER